MTIIEVTTAMPKMRIKTQQFTYYIQHKETLESLYTSSTKHFIKL